MANVDLNFPVKYKHWYIGNRIFGNIYWGLFPFSGRFVRGYKFNTTGKYKRIYVIVFNLIRFSFDIGLKLR